jgi:2',3'-cyclic-nucleotide 2'-phosphodiesterase (5'-nucleotidase family)
LLEECVANHHNLLFVMNGDFTDGTGLSAYPPSHLTPILQKMPWDALNIGNHELYVNSTIEHITEGGFTEFWGAKYVTSNVLSADHGRALKPVGGARHIVWEGPTAKVLIFGFLYDMTENSPLVIVEPVEQVLEQPWFASALREDYQAIVCMVHMDVKDPLILAILAKIRSIAGDAVPVQFISGHSHVRAFQQMDEYSTSFEAGHYLDTIGFVSFGFDGTNVQYEFIDASVDRLQSILGVDDIMTKNGAEVQSMIHKAQEQLGLLDNVGCSPDHFRIDVELSHPQSLWRFFMEKVVTGYYFGGSPSSVYVQSSGSFRYDIYNGQVTLDDIISANPFNDTIVRLSNAVKGRQIIQVLGGQINSLKSSVPWLPHLPDYVCSVDDIDPEKTYDLYTIHADVGHFVECISNITGRAVDPEYQNVTTTDLLLNFISQEWQSEEDCQGRLDYAYPYVLFGLASSFCAIIVVVVFVVVRRKRALVGYDKATTAAEESAGMPDDSAFDDEYTDELI